MNKNQELFELIQSMNGSEKRFFKIQSGRHRKGAKNNYLKLFELFDQFPSFDNEAIDHAAKKASFVNYFPAEKNQLYRSILDALDVYHKTTSIDRQISKMINQGRILLEKKLAFQAKKLLEKARKLSIEQNRHEYLITINQLLVRKAFDKETLTEEFLENSHREALVAVEKIQTKLYYRHAFDKLHLTRRMHGDISDMVHLQELTAAFPHLEEPFDPQSDSFCSDFAWDAEVYYCLSRLEFCRLARRRTELGVIGHHLLSCMENQRNKITGEFIDRYSYTLYVMLLMGSFQKKLAREQAFAKLRNIEQYLEVRVTEREQARTFEYHATNTTDLYLKTKEYAKIHDYLKELEPAEKQYSGHMTPSFSIALHYNIAALFFNMGDYRSALKWGNKISMAGLAFRKDIYHFLRTLNLIIHLELEHEESLRSVMNSILYFNRKHGVQSQLQTALVQHVRHLQKLKNRNDEQKAYERLQETFERLLKMPTENAIFEDLNLMAWVNNKIKKGRN